ncbi:MAG: hypothetical protein AAGD18_22035 [Actinomycetota bacterium]
MKLLNPTVSFLIRRGWGPVSRQLMEIRWTGRRSGNEYSTPVSRHELDGRLFTTTRAPYKHNFAGGAPAMVVLDGERRTHVGTLVDDPGVVGARLRTMLDALGPKRGPRAFGVKIEGDPTVEELATYAADGGVVVIDFEPATPPP